MVCGLSSPRRGRPQAQYRQDLVFQNAVQLEKDEAGRTLRPGNFYLFDHVHRIETAIGTFPAGKWKNGDRVTVCFRLADIEVAPASEKRPERGVYGRIASRRFVGIAELLDIYVDGRDEPVRARIRSSSLEPGTGDVIVFADPGSAMVFEGG